MVNKLEEVQNATIIHLTRNRVKIKDSNYTVFVAIGLVVPG